MQLGKYNNLLVNRESKIGLFLKDDEGNEVLLPNRYVTDDMRVGELIKVFLYNDSEGRLIATTLEPKATVNSLALLECRELNDVGAFMELGVMKDLLVPKKNMIQQMIPGRMYLVWVYEDRLTKRLVGTCNLDRIMSDQPIDLEKGDGITIRVWFENESGWRVVVNDEYLGLVYRNQVFQPLEIGDTLKAYVNQVRDDGRIDVLLQKPGIGHIDDASEMILKALEQRQGFLSLTDSSSPEEIKDALNLSKKAFKRAVGSLYKQRMIELQEDGIRLIGNLGD